MASLSVVGKSTPKVDSLEKVTGSARYALDVTLPRMLYAKVLRSTVPHARILSIDTNEAEKLRGVKAVITAEDTLKEKVETTWHGKPDKYPIAMDRVRYIGEEVAAIAAEDELTAEEALSLIKVTYEALPAVFEPEEAIKPDAPRIQEDVDRNIIHQVDVEYGVVSSGFKKADYIFENTYATCYIHECALEPTVCLASFDTSGKLTFWENSNDPFTFRRLVAKALGITPSDIRIRQHYIGGNFGHYQTELAQYVITALLAKKTSRPVKLVLTREEEMSATRPRQPVTTYLKYGVMKDGTLTARHIETVVNVGPYCGFSAPMMSTGLAVCTGLYSKCPNVKLEGKCVHTNTLPSSPSGSFGIKQPQFAQESMMDKIAEALNMDPFELRLKNAVGPGDTTMIGQKIGSCGLRECIERLDETDWKEKRSKKLPNRGIGAACAMSHSDGMGRTPDHFGGDIAYVRLQEDGRVRIISGEFDWGQGSHTVLSQMVAEELGVPAEYVGFCEFDTDNLPPTLGPYGEGRVTLVAGHAVRLAAMDAKKQLFEVAAQMIEANPDDLELKDQRIFVKGSEKQGLSMADVAGYARHTILGGEIIGKGMWEPDTQLLDLKKIYGNYSSGYIYYAQVLEVEVDPGTGEVIVLDAAVSMDVGKAINPMTVEGQGHREVGHEIGVALMEEVVYKEGSVMNPSLIDYKLPTALDVPPIKVFIVESNEAKGPYGAKGGAHPGIPTAPALANAIYNAVGVRIKDLPITSDKILRALEEQRGI